MSIKEENMYGHNLVLTREKQIKNNNNKKRQKGNDGMRSLKPGVYSLPLWPGTEISIQEEKPAATNSSL